jgi:hypothetical protein
MSFYIEIMCDVRDDTSLTDKDDNRIYRARCYSDLGDGPQSNSMAGVKEEAKKQKWIIIKSKACCPGCASTINGKIAIAIWKSLT